MEKRERERGYSLDCNRDKSRWVVVVGLEDRKIGGKGLSLAFKGPILYLVNLYSVLLVSVPFSTKYLKVLFYFISFYFIFLRELNWKQE